MAALTWRDVAAPDFRPAMEGYRQFSELMNGAFGGLERGLEKFDNQRTEEVNADLMAKIAGAQDSDAAKVLAQSIASDPNRRRYSATAFQALMSRPGDLTKQAAAESDLDFTDYSRARTKDENAALDAAREDATRFITASTTGDDAEASRIMANSSAIKGLNISQLMELATKGQNLTKGNVDILGSRQDQKIQLSQEGRNSEEFGWRRTDRADETAAQQIAAQALADGGGTAEGARASFMALSGKMSPRARFLAMGLINQNMGSGIFAPDEIAAVGGGSGAGGGSDPSALAVGYGGTPIPDSIQTVGDLVRNKSALVASRGASPVGVYQINADTWADFAPRVLKGNWANAPIRDLNVQDKVAKAIFESTKGDGRALWDKSANGGKGAGRWAALGKYSQEQINQIAKMPWEQAREIIAKGESGASPAALFGASTAASGMLAARAMQDDRDGVIGDFAAARLDRSDQSQVVASLLEGPFKGTDRGFMLRQVNRIMRDGDVNAAMAGAILRRSIDEDDPSFLSGLWRRFNRNGFGGNDTPDLGGGVRLNDKKLNEFIKDAKSGKLYDQAVSQQRTADVSQQIVAARQDYNQKMARYQQAQRRAETGGMSPANLARYQQDVIQAQQVLQGLLTMVVSETDDQGIPTLMPQRANSGSPGILRVYRGEGPVRAQSSGGIFRLHRQGQ